MWKVLSIWTLEEFKFCLQWITWVGMTFIFGLNKCSNKMSVLMAYCTLSGIMCILHCISAYLCFLSIVWKMTNLKYLSRIASKANLMASLGLNTGFPGFQCCQIWWKIPNLVRCFGVSNWEILLSLWNFPKSPNLGIFFKFMPKLQFQEVFFFEKMLIFTWKYCIFWA